MSRTVEQLQEDKIYNRKVLLEAMNNYILNVIGDEEVSFRWWEVGVPDEADDDIYTSIAEDDDLWTSVAYTFAQIIIDEEAY